MKSEDSFDSDIDIGSRSRSNNNPRNSNDTGSFQAARLGTKKFGEDSVQPRGSDTMSHSLQPRFGGDPQDNKEKKRKKKSKKSSRRET